MQNSNETQNDTSSNRPTHSLYVVKNNGGQDVWEKVGVAWAHKDGKGFNQIISFFEWNIKLTMRENKEQQ